MFIQETVMMLMFLCMYTCIRKLVWIERSVPYYRVAVEYALLSYHIVLSNFGEIHMKHLSVLIVLMVLLYYFSAVIFVLETEITECIFLKYIVSNYYFKSGNRTVGFSRRTQFHGVS